MSYMNNLLSNYITGFRKLHDSQHGYGKMLENWKNALGKGESVCALFIDLSKAFDTINHDLLLAKLNSLSADPTKLSNTLKQFVGKSRQISWVCLTSFWHKMWKMLSYYFILIHWNNVLEALSHFKTILGA